MKSRVCLFLFFLLCLQNAYSLSFVYKEPEEPFDSEVRLRRFGIYSEDPVDFGYYGKFDPSELPESVYIHIAGPGPAIYEQYGHAGIVLEYENYGRIFCDYGVFDESSPGFFNNFIHGNLYYSLAVHHLEGWDDYLKSQKRSSKLYKLNLNDGQKRQLQSFLSYNAKKENRIYLYDFFTDNCSTRVRDIVDKVYDGRLSEISAHVPCGTYRSAIERPVRPYWLYEAFYNIGFGSGQDKVISYYDAMFLPEYLEEGLKDLMTEEVSYVVPEEPASDLFAELLDDILLPLGLKHVPPFFSKLGRPDAKVFYKTVHAAELYAVSDNDVIYAPSVVRGSHLGPAYGRYILPVLLLVLLNLSALFFRDRRFAVIPLLFAFVIEFVFAVMSAVFIYLSVFSIHKFVWFNYNLIYMNPFLFVLSACSLRMALPGASEIHARRFMVMHIVELNLCLLALVLKIFYTQTNLYLIASFFVTTAALVLPVASRYREEIENIFKRVAGFFFKGLKIIR